MIGRLCGTLEAFLQEGIILDVGGVGYEIQIALGFQMHLTLHQTLTLWIETLWRQDSIRLIGFPSLEERLLFRDILKVQGAGTKVGLNLLSELGFHGTCQALLTENRQALTRVAGIGAQLSSRLISELKPRLMSQKNVAFSSAWGQKRWEVIEALESLGYVRAQIEPILQTWKPEWNQRSVEELLPHILSLLMPSN
jgi:holliday junction DNA helicase RuvA